MSATKNASHETSVPVQVRAFKRTAVGGIRQAAQQPADQQIKKDASDDVKKKAGEMKPVKAPVPDHVIEHVGNVLNGPVMAGIGLREESLPKHLKNEKRTLNERISSSQEVIVPDALAV